jgi:GntR family transcriptional regulator
MEADILSIRPSAPEPIYRQIADQLRRLIASGRLVQGAELPSVREVAVRHAINPMTVSRAYSQLEAAGLLERRRGKGMIVATSRRQPQSDNRRLELLEPNLRYLAQQVRELALPPAVVFERLRTLMADKR